MGKLEVRGSSASREKLAPRRLKRLQPEELVEVVARFLVAVRAARDVLGEELGVLVFRVVLARLRLIEHRDRLAEQQVLVGGRERLPLLGFRQSPCRKRTG